MKLLGRKFCFSWHRFTDVNKLLLKKNTHRNAQILGVELDVFLKIKYIHVTTTQDKNREHCLIADFPGISPSLLLPSLKTTTLISVIKGIITELSYI